MPSKSLRMFAGWSNYNSTVGEPHEPYGSQGMTIENLFSLHCSDVDPDNPIETLGGTGQVLIEYLADLDQIRRGNGPVGYPPREFKASTVGHGWSFAPLVGTPVAQLLTDGLSWSSRAIGPLARGTYGGDPDHLVIAGGGTRLRELITLAEESGLSLPTGGSHLGQSVAGGCATGTHGSRLGRGGLQNMVRAMHIVTGPQSHVWVQRASDPVLDDATIAQIKMSGGENSGTDIPCRPVTDDTHFENALIHLGAMGIVNALVVELEETQVFDVFAIDRQIDDKWLEILDKGDFAKIGRQLGFKDVPLEFYELTIDPQDPFGPSAAHLVYTKDTPAAGAEAVVAKSRPAPTDTIARIGGVLTKEGLEGDEPFLKVSDGSTATAAVPGGPLDPAVIAVLRQLLAKTGASSIFEHYLRSAPFRKIHGQVDPAKDIHAKGPWSRIHGDEITGGMPGALYNASFAIERKDTSRAIAAIVQAVSGLEPSFVFTMRFVDDAAGTLAFTRFPKNTVIEIDGLSPLAIGLARRLYVEQQAAQGKKPDVNAMAAFALLETTLARGAYAVRAALGAAGVDYSMHWAKLGDLDAAKVAADYGNKIDSWRATRNHLVGSDERAFFSNDAVEGYGLLPS